MCSKVRSEKPAWSLGLALLASSHFLLVMWDVRWVELYQSGGEGHPVCSFKQLSSGFGRFLMGKPPKAEGSLLDYHGVYSGYLFNLEKQRFIGREGKPCRTVGFGEDSLGFLPGYGTTPCVLTALEINRDFPGTSAFSWQESHSLQSLQLPAPHPIATTLWDV